MNGSRVSRWIASVGLLIVAACVVALHESIAAQWYIYRLAAAEPAARSHAARRLGELRREEAAERLLALAKEDSDSGVRRESLLALLRTGPAVAGALLESEFDASKGHCPLLDAIDEKDLESIRAAVRALLACSRSENGLVRSRAGCALWQLGPLDQSLLPELTSALRDPNVHVRRVAAFVLGQMRAAAGSTITELRRASTGDHEYVREAAGFALERIDEPAASNPAAKVRLNVTDGIAPTLAPINYDETSDESPAFGGDSK